MRERPGPAAPVLVYCHECERRGREVKQKRQEDAQRGSRKSWTKAADKGYHIFVPCLRELVDECRVVAGQPRTSPVDALLRGLLGDHA